MNLFQDDPDQSYEVGNRKCTEETLLEFIKRVQRIHGRPPNLHECKAEFGGILGPMMVGHELRRKGLI